MERPFGAAGVVDEAGLLEALRAGQDAAFESLVRSHAGRMRSTAQRLLRNSEDADDAVQEAFLSAFRSLDRFEGRSGLGTWLHRITINVALMRLRARKEATDEDLGELLPRFRSRGPFYEHQEPWADPGEDPLVREELCTEVRKCIDRLPDHYRIPLLLRDIEGLSNDEVAAELGVSSNAAKIRVHRARQALRSLMEPSWREMVG